MRVPVYKVQSNLMRTRCKSILFNVQPTKIDPLPQEQSVGQDVLNQVTQRNTTANSKYTHCIPKLISVERVGGTTGESLRGLSIWGKE